MEGHPFQGYLILTSIMPQRFLVDLLHVINFKQHIIGLYKYITVMSGLV